MDSSRSGALPSLQGVIREAWSPGHDDDAASQRMGQQAAAMDVIRDWVRTSFTTPGGIHQTEASDATAKPVEE